jgi:formylglycine-generating enzyme required for sulfatase activity
MHGNVTEWCLDTFASYDAAPVTNPVVTGGAFRVVRGGSWFTNSIDCRSAYRSFIAPANVSPTIGFRVVLAPIVTP